MKAHVYVLFICIRILIMLRYVCSLINAFEVKAIHTICQNIFSCIYTSTSLQWHEFPFGFCYQGN